MAGTSTVVVRTVDHDDNASVTVEVDGAETVLLYEAEAELVAGGAAVALEGAGHRVVVVGPSDAAASE
jgi:hypothetical protein